jgi:thioredoxin 1
MATLNVTEKTFVKTVKRGTVLIAFGATRCGQCLAFAPVFEAASSRHPDVVFGKVDSEAELGLAAAFEIRTVPTLLVVRDRVLLGAFSGVMPDAWLDALIQKVRDLDMDEVRRDAEPVEATILGAAKKGVA